MKETTKEALLAIVDRMERPGPKDQHSADHDMAVEIDWLIDEGYLWTSANATRTFEGVTYWHLRMSEKGEQWLKGHKAEEATLEARLRRMESRIGKVLEQTKAEEQKTEALHKQASKVGRAWSGSSIGTHADIYYADLQAPPAGCTWDAMWGDREDELGLGGTRGEWRHYDRSHVEGVIYEQAGTSAEEMSSYAEAMLEEYEQHEGDLKTCLELSEGRMPESMRTRLMAEVTEARNRLTTANAVAWDMARRAVPGMSQDAANMAAGPKVAGHIGVLGGVEAARRLRYGIGQLARISKTLREALETEMSQQAIRKDRTAGNAVFIGHGRKQDWRAFKDFIEDELGMEVREFSREPQAGKQIKDNLVQMVAESAWAVIVMNKEASHADGGEGARANVIHELGYAQGALGWEHAIVLLEKGCQLPSNLAGTVYIEFQEGKPEGAYDWLRKTLKQRQGGPQG